MNRKVQKKEGPAGWEKREQMKGGERGEKKRPHDRRKRKGKRMRATRTKRQKVGEEDAVVWSFVLCDFCAVGCQGRKKGCFGAVLERAIDLTGTILNVVCVRRRGCCGTEGKRRYRHIATGFEKTCVGYRLDFQSRLDVWIVGFSGGSRGSAGGSTEVEAVCLFCRGNLWDGVFWSGYGTFVCEHAFGNA